MQNLENINVSGTLKGGFLVVLALTVLSCLIYYLTIYKPEYIIVTRQQLDTDVIPSEVVLLTTQSRDFALDLYRKEVLAQGQLAKLVCLDSVSCSSFKTTVLLIKGGINEYTVIDSTTIEPSK